MPDDNELRARVVVDTSGLERLAGGVETATQQIQRMNAAFQEQGLSAEEAAEALKSLGFSATAVSQALGQVTTTSGAATAAVGGLDRALQTAGTRMAVTELGLGRMGLALGRVGVAAGVLGPIISAAFPVIAVVGMVDLLDQVAEKIEAVRNKALDQDIAWQQVDHSIITFADHQDKAIAEADAKLEHFTKVGLGQMDDEIKKTTVDVDILFQHFEGMFSKFEADQKKFGKGFFMQFLTGEGGTGEVVDLAKHVQDAVDQSLNAKDTKGAHAAISEGLADIKKREEELSQISGSGDRLKAYRQLTLELKAQNEAIDKQIELTAKENAAAAAQSFDVQKKATHTEGMEFSKKAAEEELETIERTASEIKKTHEEGMKDSKEMAGEELEQIERAATARKQAAAEGEVLRMTSLEQIKKEGETEVHSIQQSTALKISEAEKTGQYGAAKDIAAGGFAQEASVLKGLVTAESKYQAAVGASNLEIEKKNQLILESGKRQVELQDQITQELQKTEKLEQEIGDKNPWKIMQNDLQRTTTLLSAQTSMAQNFTNQLNSGVGSALTQWIVSGKNFGKTMEDTFVHILASEASFVAEWLLKKAELWAMDAIIGKPSQISSAMGSITANSAVAASGAAASVAAIPFVGWAMAPEVAAETFASTMAYASLIAFEKGGIVGRTGPALVHAGEAVLPRNLTTMLQGAAGRGNAGRGITVNYNAHVHAIDTKGVSDLLREHGEAFSSHLFSEMRRRNM